MDKLNKTPKTLTHGLGFHDFKTKDCTAANKAHTTDSDFDDFKTKDNPAANKDRTAANKTHTTETPSPKKTLSDNLSFKSFSSADSVTASKAHITETPSPKKTLSDGLSFKSFSSADKKTKKEQTPLEKAPTKNLSASLKDLTLPKAFAEAELTPAQSKVLFPKETFTSFKPLGEREKNKTYKNTTDQKKSYQNMAVQRSSAPIVFSFQTFFTDILFSFLLLTLILSITFLNFEQSFMSFALGTDSSLFFYGSVSFLFLSIYWFYTFTARSFFGKTLGDRAFQFQVGTPEQQSSWTYPFQLLFRQIVIVLTFLLSPIFYFLLKVDIPGTFSRLKLYKIPQEQS